MRSYKMKDFKKLISKHNQIYFKELPLSVKVEFEAKKATWMTFTLVDKEKMFEEEIVKIQHNLQKDKFANKDYIEKMNQILDTCNKERSSLKNN